MLMMTPIVAILRQTPTTTTTTTTTTTGMPTAVPTAMTM
jgi:hypothetical protein